MKRECNQMSRVLITGGAGFIGSHLSERLLGLGWDVIALDNLHSGEISNISHLLPNPRFQFVKHDITEFVFIPVDLIVNLACPASPVYYQQDPVRTVRTNVLGSLNVLELAKRLSVPVLQASTSEVYGDPLISPQTESYLGNVNPIGIRACYDEGKRVAETLFFDYHREFGVKIKVARIFNTYGPRMRPDDGRVVTNFLVQAINNEPITIYGDGSQTRSFCYISDMVNALIAMINSPVQVTGPINLGNPSEFSMHQLAQLVIKITDSSSTIVYLPLPLDDPKQRKPDISLAKNQLNWSPEVDLEIGLLETYRDISVKLRSVSD
jgi:UDP-glucuronate decarboxylase